MIPRTRDRAIVRAARGLRFRTVGTATGTAVHFVPPSGGRTLCGRVPDRQALGPAPVCEPCWTGLANRCHVTVERLERIGAEAAEEDR